MAYRVIASEILFSGRVFKVRKDRVVLEDGRESSVDVVVHPGAVALIPVDSGTSSGSFANTDMPPAVNSWNCRRGP